jgi:hypothetical protein
MNRKTKETVAVVLICALAWCCLLFGIGLDDLTDSRTNPGAIFSVIVLLLLIAGLLYGLYKLVNPAVRRRFANHS